MNLRKKSSKENRQRSRNVVRDRYLNRRVVPQYLQSRLAVRQFRRGRRCRHRPFEDPGRVYIIFTITATKKNSLVKPLAQSRKLLEETFQILLIYDL